MSLEECAEEFCACGWTPYVDEDFTRRKFATIENKRR